MTFKSLGSLALFGALLRCTFAQSQQSNIVPEDLRNGFRGGSVEVQVSYVNRAIDGFRDGTQFEKDAVSQEPTFALGDSSGISPTTLYTIIMVDTTCPNKRVLHYARANFKNNFDITNIATQSAPLQAYKAPGAFGEAGDNRQYSFLMYTNPQRRQIDTLRLPKEGETFDVKKFQSDNGLNDPQAGVGMIVKLGGTADCGGEQANTLPASRPSAQPSTSAAGQTPTASIGVSSNTNAGPTPTIRGTTSPAISRPSSASAVPSSQSSGNSSRIGNENNNGSIAAGEPANRTSAVQSNVQSVSEATSVAEQNTGRPTSSLISSAGVAQQTANAAPSGSVGEMGMLLPVFAIVRLVLW